MYIVAGIIVLVIAGLLVLRVFSDQLTRLALVPTVPFESQPSLPTNAYADPAMWFARPGLAGPDPTRFRPLVEGDEDASPQRLPPPPVQDYAVFFLHPTSYIERSRWNAPLNDAQSQEVARTYLRGMASPFANAAQIWAPRYRQATVGAFLTDEPDAEAALALAYADVAAAFRAFVAGVPQDMPIVLAGHSQGSLHLLTLLRQDVSDTLRTRIAAAYVIGWPVSIERDLPALRLPLCGLPGESGCIVTWSSFAEPADPESLLETYSTSIGFDGMARGNTRIACTNPLTGQSGGAAQASANLGTLRPSEDNGDGTLVPGAVPARCDARGLLLIGDPPAMGAAVLPGNNYHVYDIPLFWANLRADVSRRVAAFGR
nr:DUF3089 domain-containing protein [Porphyrobacter sp. GA68]